MTGAPLRILLVEDSADDAALLARTLERAGRAVQVERVEDREGMERALAGQEWDLVISDHSLPRFDSAAAIATLRAVDQDVGCIIVSGQIGEDAAVEAMRNGADDYVLKERLTTLPAAIERTLRTAEVRRERRRAEGRYRSLIESAPDGIATVDRDGVVTSLNPAFEAMTGFSVAQAISHHFHEFIHPDDAAAMTAGFAEALATAAPIQAKIRVRHGSGLYFVAELTVARLVEAGETVGLFGIFRDITERRTMEQELRTSEAHLRTLVESAPDGIYTLAPSGEVQSINPAFKALLGLDFTLVGRRFREVVHPDDIPVAVDTFTRRLQGEVVPPYELRLLHSDGSPVEVEITSSRLRDGEKITGTLGIVRDIRRRKKDARELALREERFRLVTTATQDAVYDWDLAKDLIWWNEGATVIFGVAPPTGSGLDWWSAQLHPEDHERVVTGLERAAAEHEALWTDEYRLRHTDGGWRVVTDRGLYLYDERGTAVRMIGAMTDVTGRRQAEAEQARLQVALQGAATDWTVTFDAVPMFVLLVDEAGRVRRVNKAVREAISMSWGELLQRSVGELPGEPWVQAAILVQRALATGMPMVEQKDDPTSSRTWNLAVAPVTTSEGRQVVLLIRDTTDLVALQRTISHQRTMAALGALVAGVAHEVRNPLFAISATLDAFEARFGKEPEFSKYTGHLRPEVQRLSALMRDLLEYGRPAALQPVRTDLLPVLREAIERSEPDAAERGIRITLEGAEGPLVVDHDPGRFLQVIQNLLDNALVHAPAKSRIVVAVRAVERDQGRWLAVAVEDAGTGFRAEDLPHVFEPFYSRRRGGTGLGLSIVERLVGQHGGRVLAENRPDGGARVTVLLPLT